MANGRYLAVRCPGLACKWLSCTGASAHASESRLRLLSGTIPPPLLGSLAWPRQDMSTHAVQRTPAFAQYTVPHARGRPIPPVMYLTRRSKASGWTPRYDALFYITAEACWYSIEFIWCNRLGCAAAWCSSVLASSAACWYVHAGRMQQRVLAYLSDANFLPVALQPHGESVWTGRIQSATVSTRQYLTNRDSTYRTAPCSTQLRVVRHVSCCDIHMSYHVPAAVHTAQIQTIHSGTHVSATLLWP